MFAECTLIHKLTRYTLFYLVYSCEAVLLIKTKYLTWRTLGWNDICIHKELLVIRTRQFEMHDKDILKAIAKQTQKQQEGQEYYDRTHNIRKKPIYIKDIILYYNTFIVDQDKSKSIKLS